jgi:hypothetical protein
MAKPRQLNLENHHYRGLANVTIYACITLMCVQTVVIASCKAEKPKKLEAQDTGQPERLKDKPNKRRKSSQNHNPNIPAASTQPKISPHNKPKARRRFPKLKTG